MTFSTELRAIVGENEVIEQAPMARHTTMGTGGPAAYLVFPGSTDELRAVIEKTGEAGLPLFILGRGSNLLVSDKGFPGVVVSFKKRMRRVTVSGNEIIAEAGAMMNEVAKAALSASLTGFEFGDGIPGTIGGGLVMNAGAYDGELSGVVKEAAVLLEDGTVRTLGNGELELSYRHSILQEKNWVVLSVTLSLKPGDPEAIREKMEDLRHRRMEKQPLEYPSAGSTFKRPAGYFAGALIDDAKLRGYTVGGAAVSLKHAGFVVNLGHATSADVLSVIRHVQDKVYENSGVKLEQEVKLLGDFS